MIPYLQTYLFLALFVAAFAIQIWAVVSAARFSGPLFIAAGKRTKGFWLVLLIPAVVIGFCSIPPPIGLGFNLMLLNIVAFVAAAVYLTDVRPRLQELSGGRGGNGGRGRNTNTGGW